MPEALQCAVKRGEKGQAAIEGKRSGRKELFFMFAEKRGQAPFFKKRDSPYSSLIKGIKGQSLKKRGLSPFSCIISIKRCFNFRHIHQLKQA